MLSFSHSISKYLIAIWVMNCTLACGIAIKQVWIPYMNAGWDGYTKIISEPFDGTVMPISYIPDWTKTTNQDKSKRFEDISISEFLPIPLYDPLTLLDERNQTKWNTILRYTYFTTYMGNYKLDYHEHAGGHLWVDIRAPIGTPVLSIANGVITRISEWDSTGNKFIVVRHDNVEINGKKTNLYSWYLHLSEILVREWDIVRKWTMIGRVGMTGIATTPHLHLQIDTGDAPFHPYWHFTSSESRSAGVWFFDAVNTWLNKDKALKYTIHPMVFINTYLGGTNTSQNIIFNSAPTEEKNTIITSSAVPIESKKVIASYMSEADSCIGKRFVDVPLSSSFGKTLYPLVDKKCIFSDISGNFESKNIINYREALINTMRYFDIAPASGNSHFLDVPLWDVLQGYAIIAYRNGIVDGSYLYPDRIMSREELAVLITKVAKAEKNPSQMKIYSDVDMMNPAYSYIQDYAFMTRTKWGKFYPKTLVTRGMLIQMLTNIKQ